MTTNRLTEHLKPQQHHSVNRVFDVFDKQLTCKQKTEARRITAADLLQPVAEMKSLEVLRYLEDIGLAQKIQEEFYYITGKKIKVNELLLFDMHRIDDNKDVELLKEIISKKFRDIYQERLTNGPILDIETIKAIVQYLKIDDFQFDDEVHFANLKFTRRRLAKYLSN